MDALLTVAEVATSLRLDRETVRRMIRKGTLPAVKFGNTYRIRLADVEAITTPETPKRQPRNQRERIAHLARLAS